MLLSVAFFVKELISSSIERDRRAQLYESLEKNLANLSEEVKAQRREIDQSDEQSKKEFEAERNLQDKALKQGNPLYTEGLSPENRHLIVLIAKRQIEQDKRLQALETSILESPERAASTQLLRQKTSDLDEKYKALYESLNSEIAALSSHVTSLATAGVALIVALNGALFATFKHLADQNKQTAG